MKERTKKIVASGVITTTILGGTVVSNAEQITLNTMTGEVSTEYFNYSVGEVAKNDNVDIVIRTRRISK